jgi:hypothetical protein
VKITYRHALLPQACPWPALGWARQWLKPYRFSVPAIGLLLGTLLMVLPKSLDNGYLSDLFGIINFPATVVFVLIRDHCFQGDSVFYSVFGYGYWSWIVYFLFVVSLFGLWWYLVGLELDLGLLRLLASKALPFCLCWLLIAVGLQALAIHIIVKQIIEIVRYPSNHTKSGYYAANFLTLLEGGWFQVIAWRFWRAWRVRAAQN